MGKDVRALKSRYFEMASSRQGANALISSLSVGASGNPYDHTYVKDTDITIQSHNNDGKLEREGSSGLRQISTTS